MPFGELPESRFEVAHDEHIVGLPRVIRDPASGEMTTVVERRADHTAGARGPRCLIFSNDRGFIRIWEYPEQWSALSDGELMRLSEYRRNGGARSA